MAELQGVRIAYRRVARYFAQKEGCKKRNAKGAQTQRRVDQEGPREGLGERRHSSAPQRGPGQKTVHIVQY